MNVDKIRRKYDAGFKLQVVNHAENVSKTDASKVFCVDRKRVIEWCKQKNSWLEVEDHPRDYLVQGRKALSSRIEDKLVEIIRTKRKEKMRVTRKMTCLEAIKLHRDEGNKDFKASQGWLFNFMKRNKISLRRKTTVSQRLPRDLVPKVVKHVIAI